MTILPLPSAPGFSGWLSSASTEHSESPSSDRGRYRNRRGDGKSGFCSMANVQCGEGESAYLRQQLLHDSSIGDELMRTIEYIVDVHFWVNAEQAIECGEHITRLQIALQGLRAGPVANAVHQPGFEPASKKQDRVTGVPMIAAPRIVI